MDSVDIKKFFNEFSAKTMAQLIDNHTQTSVTIKISTQINRVLNKVKIYFLDLP